MADISVIFASRQRPNSLSRAVTSLMSTANHPENIEVIIAVDPDDEMSKEAELPEQARLWVAPERYGYTKLHWYLNALAKQAAGRWLMWFNDDMLMTTAGWDDVILANRPAVIWPEANHVHHANIAPAWPKVWSDTTGRASPSTHMDTYWQRVAEALGRHDRVPIGIVHDRADVTGNHIDQTYAEGRELLGPEGMAPGFDSGIFHQQVAMDAAIIRQLL